MTYVELEEMMKQEYREYLLRIKDLVNFAGICRKCGVNYVNFKKFLGGNDSYLSIEKLALICKTISDIEKIA